MNAVITIMAAVLIFVKIHPAPSIVDAAAVIHLMMIYTPVQVKKP